MQSRLAPLLAAALSSPVLAAATVDGIDLVRDGQRARVEVVLAVVATPIDGPLAGALHTTPWQAHDGSLRRQVEGPLYQATLTMTAAANVARVEIEIQYRAAVRLQSEGLRLVLPGSVRNRTGEDTAPRALDRELSFRPLGGPLRVDRGTPILAATPQVLLTGEAGFVAARFTPDPRGLVVELLIDDPAAHPFHTFPRCAPRYRAPDERVRVDRSARLRTVGETVHASARLYLREGRLLPLIVERWAGAARAAVVFTDHADRTDAPALAALLHGRSDDADVAAPSGGFDAHQLRLTKTFFARGDGGALDAPAIAALAGQLVAHGHEVGSHSPTPQRDRRDTVAADLAAFQAHGATTWIDHQPTTNCEAIANQGSGSDGEFGIRDLLVDAGFRWLWAATDLPSHGAPRLLNLFQPQHRDLASPPLFAAPFDARLWLFRSSWFVGTPAQLAAALSAAGLATLERERGLFIGHTYLSASRRTTRMPSHQRTLVVRPRRGGGLELVPTFEAALGRLGARVAAGSIASLTLAAAAARLRDIDAVRVSYSGDGTATVRSAATAILRGLRVAVADGDVELAPLGAQGLGSAREPGRVTAWFDLPAGGAVTLQLQGRAGAIPFVAGGDLAVAPSAEGPGR